MTWVQITCEAREALVEQADREYGWWSQPGGVRSGICVLSALTDLDGRFGDPLIITEWGVRETEVPILKDVRHPQRGGSGPDARPCEHYRWSANRMTDPTPQRSAP